MNASQQPSVFFSYAREDATVVNFLMQVARAGGAKVFLDTCDLQFGELWEERIVTEIEKCARVIVLWSKRAAQSQWVEKEISLALALGKPIVPVCIGGVALSPRLAKFHGIPNFDALISEASESLRAGIGLHHVGRNFVHAVFEGKAYISVRGGAA